MYQTHHVRIMHVHDLLERFHSRGQNSRKFIGKEQCYTGLVWCNYLAAVSSFWNTKRELKQTTAAKANRTPSIKRFNEVGSLKFNV